MIFLLLLSLFSVSPARAKTSYSSLLERIQDSLLREAAPYPILIMDRDDLEWRFARAGALGKQGELKRAELIRHYVRERTGREISFNAAANFETYLGVLKDSAVAMPAMKDGVSSGIEMCAVFPPDPNRNRRLETERILQLRVQDAYGDRSFARLRDSLGYDDAILISLLHEAGHCMDRFFFPMLFAGAEDPHTIHQAESFAETMALLLMAREGRRAGGTRAYLRDVYSYFMQPWFTANAEKGMFNPAFPYGGLIYHLSPVIREASALLDREPGIEGGPLAQLQERAAGIVRASSFSSKLLTALYASYSEGREPALQRYEELKRSMPDFFADTPEQMRAYFLRADSFRADAFLPAPPESREPETELLPVEMEKLCSLYRDGGSEELLSEIERLRLDLRTGNPSAAAEQARFELLSDLWSRLPGQCGGKALLSGIAELKRERELLLGRLPHRSGAGCDLGWVRALHR